MEIFREEVYERIKEDMQQHILAEIDKERNGEGTDHQLIKGLIGMYLTLAKHKKNNKKKRTQLVLYQKDFEVKF